MRTPILFALLCSSAHATGPSGPYMKGAELYAWEAPTGLVRYSLLPGTNRLKSKLEIETAGAEPSEALKEFSKIPKGSSIFLHTSPWVGAETGVLKFHRLDNSEVRKLRKAARSNGLSLEMD